MSWGVGMPLASRLNKSRENVKKDRNDNETILPEFHPRVATGVPGTKCFWRLVGDRKGWSCLE